MYRVVYKNKKNLKLLYLKLFKRIDVQKKWDTLIAQPNYASLVSLIPKGIKAEDLLVAEFPVLIQVYVNFGLFVSKLPALVVDDIKKQLIRVFNYKSAQPKIAKFLMENIKPLHHHCYYCDMVDVSSYKDKSGKRHHYFEIEHVLDKGECPLVGLSLFNFVPSCDHCNEDLKGSDLIGKRVELAKKLSPTINGYDFYNKVHFVINPKQGAQHLEVDKKHIEDFEVNLEYNKGADVYKHVTDMFNLKERYNEGEVKAEAIRYVELLRKNPPARIKELADQERVSYEEKFEEVFEVQFRKENKYKTLKLYEDLMNYKSK